MGWERGTASNGMGGLELYNHQSQQLLPRLCRTSKTYLYCRRSSQTSDKHIGIFSSKEYIPSALVEIKVTYEMSIIWDDFWKQGRVGGERDTITEPQIVWLEHSWSQPSEDWELAGNWNNSWFVRSKRAHHNLCQHGSMSHVSYIIAIRKDRDQAKLRWGMLCYLHSWILEEIDS